MIPEATNSRDIFRSSLVSHCQWRVNVEIKPFVLVGKRSRKLM